MDLIGAVSAVTANQWIYGLVDGVVEECKIFLTTADGGPARDFYGRRPDQQRSAELKFDFDKDDHYCTAPDVAPFLDKESQYFARCLELKAGDRNTLLEMKDILCSGPRNLSEHKPPQFDRDAIDWMARTSLLGCLQATIGHIARFPESPMREGSSTLVAVTGSSDQLLSEAGFQGEKIIDMSPWCYHPMRLIIARKKGHNS